MDSLSNKKMSLQKLMSLIIVLFTGMLIFLSLPKEAQAIADNCKDVRISVFNDHPVEVKVIKIEYKDFDQNNKWRTEDVANRKIATTKHYQFHRNLEHVKNDDTIIRVVYKESEGGSRWSGEKRVSGVSHQCSKGEYNRIHLPGPSAHDSPK